MIRSGVGSKVWVSVMVQDLSQGKIETRGLVPTCEDPNWCFPQFGICHDLRRWEVVASIRHGLSFSCRNGPEQSAHPCCMRGGPKTCQGCEVGRRGLLSQGHGWNFAELGLTLGPLFWCPQESWRALQPREQQKCFARAGAYHGEGAEAPWRGIILIFFIKQTIMIFIYHKNSFLLKDITLSLISSWSHNHHHYLILEPFHLSMLFKGYLSIYLFTVAEFITSSSSYCTWKQDHGIWR